MTIKQYAIGVDKKGLDLLRKEDKLSPESLHKLRTSTKRLRSLWKLAEPEIGTKKCKKALRSLRDSARMLGEERDLKVMRDTLALLEKKGDSGKSHKSVQSVDRFIASQSPNGKVKNSEKMKLLKKAFARDLKKWKSLGKASKGIRLDIRLAETYGRAYSLNIESWETGNINTFHKCRRWTKYLRYQLEALDIDESPRLKAGLKGFRKLGRALGRRQDLYVLRTFLESSEGLRTKDKSQLIGLIEAADGKIVDQSRKLSRSVFAMTPAEYQDSVKAELRKCGLL
ncbi:MAG: CHAD domain-containing protein [Pyrinomonadaceae bacterium]|nr:CHAD domain-containing protein [Pyrinomonadaceae bacterium]